MREHYDINSPFFNFAQEIRLNEFTLKQARHLIATPMENLRVRIKSEAEVVGQIYEETAGHPNLIQYYCMILLRHLDEIGEREIRPESLLNVHQDEGFTSQLLTSFMQNTKNREKVLTYAILLTGEDVGSRGFSLEDIDTALRKQGIVLTQDVLDEACSVLTLAGVIRRKGRIYYLTSPVFAKVLHQSYDLNFLVEKVKEEGL
jgi:hypothetical protein